MTNLCLVSFLSLGIAQTVWAAESSTSGRARSSKSSEASKSETITFRLPRHFSSIVDEEQRGEIQKIQAAYHEKITAIEQELAELEAAQMKELEGVLTSTQRKALEEMRNASSTSASGKSASGKSGGAKTSSSTSKGSSAKASGSSTKSAGSSSDSKRSKSTGASSSKSSRKTSGGD